jgi:HK97 gp10 family phage protein
MDGFKVEGLNEVKAKMEALGTKAEKSIIRKGLRQGANVIRDAARAEAPTRTGFSKGKIKVKAGKSSKGTIALTVGASAKDFGQAFYLSFVIYGHFVGDRKLGNKRTFVEPNNFLERAFEESSEEAIEATTETWKDLIEEETK